MGQEVKTQAPSWYTYPMAHDPELLSLLSLLSLVVVVRVVAFIWRFDAMEGVVGPFGARSAVVLYHDRDVLFSRYCEGSLGGLLEPEGTYPLGGTNWSTMPSSSQSTPYRS